MTTPEIANKYVALCQQGKMDACLTELFAKDAVSVEAIELPGLGREAKGLDAIRAKGKAWGENNTVHSAEVQGPYPHGDRFAVRFVFDVTNKQTGKRSKMDEVGLFSVSGGKISREEFFYSP
jgi:hypothetical protein